MHLSVSEAIKRLESTESRFIELFEKGRLTVEIYKPVQVDLQKPHIRDEIYVIIAGQGTFLHEGQLTSFSPGDFFFVPAGDEHRFADFTDDFLTWVIFIGE